MSDDEGVSRAESERQFEAARERFLDAKARHEADTSRFVRALDHVREGSEEFLSVLDDLSSNSGDRLTKLSLLEGLRTRLTTSVTKEYLTALNALTDAAIKAYGPSATDDEDPPDGSDR